ncbi:hypothetical protein DBT53_002680, partial [Aerococcus mictus]
PNDRRAQRLFLTQQAAPMLAQIWEIADEIYDEVLAGLDADNRDALAALLGRMRSNLTTMMLDPAPLPRVPAEAISK